MHSPVNFKHTRLLHILHHLLGLYAERKKLGEVHREVIAVRLSSRNVFLPDLCFFTSEQVARLAPAHAPFAPTLVVEALSPWSADREVGPKFATYEEHGVREYWVLDPELLAHRFYGRQGELLVEFASCQDFIQAQTVPDSELSTPGLTRTNYLRSRAVLLRFARLIELELKAAPGLTS